MTDIAFLCGLAVDVLCLLVGVRAFRRCRIIKHQRTFRTSVTRITRAPSSQDSR